MTADDKYGERMPWWREVWRFLRELVEVTRRPTPSPVLYLRCGDCGQVAPRTTVRRHGWLDGQATSPEYPCPLCGAYAPRVLGDQVDVADPIVLTLTMNCDVRFGCVQFWKRCGTTFPVPAAATVVMCPACGQRYAGPASHD